MPAACPDLWSGPAARRLRIRLPGFCQERLGVAFIAGREVKEGEVFGVRKGCDLAGLAGGEVVLGGGQIVLAMEKGRLDEQAVCVAGKLHDGGAVERGVADIGDVDDLLAGRDAGDPLPQLSEDEALCRRPGRRIRLHHGIRVGRVGECVFKPRQPGPGPET
jgi:hypothetical protein